MTEKQRHALSTILDKIPSDCRDAFSEVAEYAISLGYMPVLKGAKESYADFIKSKVKRTILKIDTDPKFPPRLAIKFYAMQEYSEMFAEGVERTVNILHDMGHKNLRCFGCGTCDGTEGYAYTSPEGNLEFLCGKGVISLPSFTSHSVAEVKEALRLQDEFFTK